MADAAAYHRQLEAARNVGLSMTKTQADAFLRLLEAYAEELAQRVAAGLATRGERHALMVAREIIDQLVRDMALATRNGVTITSDRVATLYAEATASLIASSPGASSAVSVQFGGLGLAAAQAVLSRPALAASFRTIQRQSVAAVDRIVAGGLLRGATTTQVARELRLHVLGADAFPAAALLDRRRIGYDVLRQMGYDATPANLRLVRADAGKIAARAQLIARTEPMNAEWEAHRQGALESPVVQAIRWEVSSSHGDRFDQCDVLQDTDFFGLGTGVYPVDALPRRAHPRCTCRARTLIRDPAEWDQPRPPAPALAVDPAEVAAAAGLTPSQSRSLEALIRDAARQAEETIRAA